MSDERLKEIEDSINLQLELCKQLKVDNEMIQEEKELYDYTIKLKDTIKKISNEIYKNQFEFTFYGCWLNIKGILESEVN